MSKKESNKKHSNEIKEVPEEFEKIVTDLVNDLKVTFPEYIPFIDKWWKEESHFGDMEDDSQREKVFKETRTKNVNTVFQHCLKKYPPRFFDILYQNEDIFKEDSEVDTEFLPQIHFRNLWTCDISQKTRETIWKYLQLIMFTIVGSVDNKESFGDTAKLFDCISEDEFKSKLEDTMEQMQKVFDSATQNGGENADGGIDFEAQAEQMRETMGLNMENMPNPEDIHKHITGMMNGKLGTLAKEIAEETAEELNLDMDNTSDVKSVFGKLFKNPGKLMGLVKNVGNKLESKIKSGEIKESEIIAEATEMMNKMKSMPGMGNMQDMLNKMGMSGMMPKGAKMNFGAMESQLKQSMKVAQMKERMKQKLDDKNASTTTTLNQQPNLGMSDEELVKIFSTGEKVERTPRGAKPPSQQPIIDSVSSNAEKKKKKKK